MHPVLSPGPSRLVQTWSMVLEVHDFGGQRSSVFTMSYSSRRHGSTVALILGAGLIPEPNYFYCNETSLPTGVWGAIVSPLLASQPPQLLWLPQIPELTSALSLCLSCLLLCRCVGSSCSWSSTSTLPQDHPPRSSLRTSTPPPMWGRLKPGSLWLKTRPCHLRSSMSGLTLKKKLKKLYLETKLLHNSQGGRHPVSSALWGGYFGPWQEAGYKNLRKFYVPNTQANHGPLGQLDSFHF